MLRKIRFFIGFVMALTVLVGISVSHFYRAARHTRNNQDLREAMQAREQHAATPNWTEQLEGIHLQTMLLSSGIRRRNLATFALADYERILPHIQSPELRIGVLTAAAYCAYEAGDLNRARTYAEKATKDESLPRPATLHEIHSVYNDSNNPFYCHLLLGRIALRKGDRNEAKHQLLAAGAVTVPMQGFCWLGPFGQTSPLAQELLQKGERKTVLEYFQRCNKSGHDGVLIQWSRDVRAGKTPDFCPIP
jgi:tetratricopeptide (TPR) repeat protein